MVINYSWKILRVDCYQTLKDSNGNEFFDVIYAVQWEITGSEMVDYFDTETNQNVLVPQNTAWVSDVIGFDIGLSNNFIERHQITEDILIQWVKQKLGEQKIKELEEHIQLQLENINIV